MAQSRHRNRSFPTSRLFLSPSERPKEENDHHFFLCFYEGNYFVLVLQLNSVEL